MLHLAQVLQDAGQLLVGRLPGGDLAACQVAQEVLDGGRRDAHPILLPAQPEPSLGSVLARLFFS